MSLTTPVRTTLSGRHGKYHTDGVKCFIVALGLFLIGMMMSTSASAALKPFSADYAFNIDGYYTGKATRSLTQQADGKWHYKFAASVPLVAKASQESTFEEKGNNLMPLTHRLSYKVLIHKRETKYSFDYSGKTIRINDKGKSRSLPLPEFPLDELIVELQIREDLKRSALKPTYQIVSRSKVEDVKFVNLGKTTVTVPAGTFEVIKVQRMHPTPKRQTFFWLSPAHDYLPIKMMQDDKGKIYSSELKSL